ncbi:hypothetical protein DAETH_28690 [Deinococcus aetherius]|uniref:Uncharacterized protein n=1 Tax=Deinococcus aetherius TaxID=200252 RepID=A0ABM8AGP7_9DEIO|nr:hypothetical protein [Deinococcus aetherius]BDP42900.1 hypothetical protein DAETH_28690 [Deinococcus aetherius]
MTHTEPRPTLPTLALNYETGTFVNTLTGEQHSRIEAVVLGYREDRTLYPSLQNPDPRPECVNGSVYGPCVDCGLKEFGPQGEVPPCSEELTLLLWQDEHAEVVMLTARRSQVRVLERFLRMKAFLGGELHDQRVTIAMTPHLEGGLNRLVLLPGAPLDGNAQGRMAALVERVRASGAFGGLS